MEENDLDSEALLEGNSINISDNKSIISSEESSNSSPMAFCLMCCPPKKESLSRENLLFGLEYFFGMSYCFGFQYIIHNPTCDFLFRCGCTWQWDGGWKNCNIWYDGPKCPWCMSRANISWTTDYLIFAFMLIVFTFFFYHRNKYHAAYRYLLPILTYFMGAIIVGFIFKLSTGYPYFIF